MNWTPERIDTLKKLWIGGLTASQVAKQLGGVTRAAVIGKVHRLGLSGRGKATAPKARAATSLPAPKVRPMAEVVTRAPASALVKHGPSSETKMGPYEQRVAGARVSAALKAAPEPQVETSFELAPWAVVETLEAHSCRWPIGNPTSDAFGFCGRRKERGPYCAEHSARARGSIPSGLQDRNLTRGLS